MADHECDIGIVGAGTMGGNPALNFADKPAVELGLPVPGLSASLAYYDAYRSAWLPTSLIQAQRDYFGSHTYERKDAPGKFLHTVRKKTEGNT